MDRDHEFSINLHGDGTYAVRLLAGVGKWPALGLVETAGTETEMYRRLLAGVVHKVADGPGPAGRDHPRRHHGPEFDGSAAAGGLLGAVVWALPNGARRAWVIGFGGKTQLISELEPHLA